MNWMDAWLSLLLPRSCPGCGGAEGTEGAGLCMGCRESCGRELRAWPAPANVDEAWALGEYRGPLGSLVRRAKFQGDLALADAMGGWLGEAVSSLPAVDAVVPVEAHWWRVLRRGHDLPVRLARPVAKTMGVPVKQVLSHAGTGSQAGRKGWERRMLESDRFCATGPTPRRILLVDDVRTTGATAAACARALRRAGAVWVCLLTPVIQSSKNVKKS